MEPNRWRLKELLYIIVAILAMIGASAMLTLVPTSSQTTAAATFRSLDGKQDGIFFLGHIFSIDIPGRTFDVLWIVGACGSLLLQSSETYDLGRAACGLPNIPLSIYINNTIGFKMTHSIDIATAQLGEKRIFDQLFWYPFDFYHSSSNFYALNANDNTSLPIVRAVFADPVNNFAPQSIEAETQAVINGTLVISRETFVGLQRTVNAKLYTFLLFVVNWALTLLVAYITMLVHVGEKLGEGIIVLPLTIILTMPTIRGLFVENPSFGAHFLLPLGSL
ncbi:hypothetical protein CVT25_000437 [Psilocybe cyanescens]|uniref:Uncharacterized protein n=1 Tax=Psilocybe cyanescens TaxID=93625 RepID=A0A409XLZ3_PSICY|nr:hypothetical protein CVT25_000437 [Psilocybe cyanescens]